jgi:L-fucose isomerase
MRASTYEWPHAFARFAAPAEDILSRYGSNHIHAVPGDRVAELRAVCRYLDIDFDGIGDVA